VTVVLLSSVTGGKRGWGPPCEVRRRPHPAPWQPGRPWT